MQRKKRSRKKGGRGVAGGGAQTGSSVHGIFPGKNTGVGCRFLLQELFPTQGLRLHLLHWQVASLPLSHLGSPRCGVEELY